MFNVDDGERSTELILLTRRSLIAANFGGFLVSAYSAQAPAIVTSKNRVQPPACTLAAEHTEGPYYIDGALIRSNITEGHPGVPLRLRIIVLDGLRCKPIENAAVSIWHCDASGLYSGFTANSPDGPPGPHGMDPECPRNGARYERAGGHPPGPPPPGFDFREGGGHSPPPFGRRSTDKTRFFEAYR